MRLNIKKTLVLLAVVSTALVSIPSAAGQTTVFGLGTTNGTGALYITNVNNEAVQPNTPGGKAFEYPYYFDPTQNLWVMVVSEQLSSSYTYAFEEANFTVLNKSVTDADFGTFSIGQLSWTSALVSGVGVENLSVAEFSLSLDLADFAPITSSRNLNNEFSWDYAATVSNLTGSGLTFQDGSLVGINFSADVAVTPRLFGNPSAAFGSSYNGTISFTGSSFAFDVDVIQDNTTFLGSLTDTHLVLDAAGTVTGVVPEPGTLGLVAFAAVGWMLRKRGKNASRS